MNAKWLFENHLNHLAMVRYLTAQAAEQARLRDQLRDETIEGLALARPCMDGMPHASSYSSSPTEWVALTYEDVLNGEPPIASALAEYRRYLRLFDCAMVCLTDNEKWLVDQHFIQGIPMAVLAQLQDNPYGPCVRSTLWRYKERVLEKVDRFLSTCHEE